MMKCDDVKKLLPDYLLGNLNESQKNQLQDHLSECPDCQAEFGEMEDIWGKMALLPGEEPDPNMRPRFYAMLEAYKHGLNRADAKNSFREKLSDWLERFWPKQPAIQLGVALSTLVIGLFIGLWSSPGTNGHGEITQLRKEVHNLNQLVTLSLLRQDSPSARLKGVHWSYQMEQPDRDVISALIHTLNYDSNVNVQLAAADALALYIEKPSVKKELIQTLLRQSSPLVQIELINILVGAKETESIPTLKQLMQKDQVHKTVRQRAQWGLQQLG